MEPKKKAAEQLVDIETLRKKNGVSVAVFEGVKADNGWKNGKQVTEEKFLGAVAAWEKAPINGEKTGGEAKG